MADKLQHIYLSLMYFVRMVTYANSPTRLLVRFLAVKPIYLSKPMTWHVLLHFFEFILGLNNVLLSMIDNETLVFFCETRLQTQTLTYTSAHWWLRLSQNLLAQSFEVCLYEWVVCMYVSLCIVIQKNILDLSSLYIICYVAYISNLNLDLRDI